MQIATSTIDPHVLVPKGWGREIWICNTQDYCGKILEFEPEKKCSVHYHVIKDEVLFVDMGMVRMSYYWNEGDDPTEIVLSEGMSFHVSPGLRHQMTAGPEGARIIEFSTHHMDSDSIRVRKGD